MSCIPALDEITEQLGPPKDIRWVSAPHGATAAIACFRHRGGSIELSPSGSFRVIFHLTPSEVDTRIGAEPSQRRTSRAGALVALPTCEAERVDALKPATTVHLLFSPHLHDALNLEAAQRISPAAVAMLRSAAIRAFVGMKSAQDNSAMQFAAASVVKALALGAGDRRMAGGLSPHVSHRIHELLARNLYAGVPVPQLAEAAGLSVHHFIKACREREGLTPHALLTNMRVERAVELLTSPAVRVDEVALACGFSSPSHFVSTFRTLVGVTPAAFRRAAAAA